MIVNSHNDWDPLEEIIVGRADHSRIATDISARSFSYANFNKEDVEKLIDKINLSTTDITADHYDWVIIGFALKSEFGETGRSMFHQISCQNPRYNHKKCNEQYDELGQFWRGG